MKKYLLIVLVVLAGALVYSSVAEAGEYCPPNQTMIFADCVYTGPPDLGKIALSPSDFQTMCRAQAITEHPHGRPYFCRDEFCRLPATCPPDEEVWVCCVRVDDTKL